MFNQSNTAAILWLPQTLISYAKYSLELIKVSVIISQSQVFWGIVCLHMKGIYAILWNLIN